MARTRTAARRLAAWLALGAAAAVAAAMAAPAPENIDPAGDGHRWAWGENIGWINVEPQGEGGPGANVGDFSVTGWLWGENVGWINLSCQNESVCATTDYGVRNDGFGRLSGFAWSENGGWVNFGPTTCAGDPTCGVRVDPATGFFRGRAWTENMGWITFSAAAPADWTARTSWCQATAASPGAVAQLRVGKTGQDLSFRWPPVQGAAWYDIVGGGLASLAASHGDFAAATRQCVESRVTATTFATPGPPVKPGDGAFFVVRGANCKGHGTYDEAGAGPGGAGQSGPRDAGIAASGADCP